jgi:hypothetical protein
MRSMRFRRVARPLLVLAAVATAAVVGAFATSSDHGAFAPSAAWAGGLTPSAARISPNPPKEERHDVSPPLAELPPAAKPHPGEKKKHVEREIPGPAASGTDAAVQKRGPTRLAPVAGGSFTGVGNGLTGPGGTMRVDAVPPDVNGAVGPNHYVQVVNESFAVFDKTGAVLYGPVPTNTLWTGFGGGCQANDDGDATVAYDRLADRWVVSQFSVSTTPFLLCVAVSATSDPTGAYYRYSFQYSSFPDYPKLGVWPDAYYVTINLFDPNTFAFQGPEVCAYDRTRMLAGQSATQKCFVLGTSYGALLPADLDGSTPPAGSPNYLLEVATGVLHLWKFHVDWANPANSTLTGPKTITVAAFTPACSTSGSCIPQAGTSTRLDALGDRLMYRLAYRNFADHESLVTTHSVVAGSSVGVRWYELRSPGGTPTVYQQGTYAPDANYRWMGSIAMDRNGNIGLGYSVSGGSMYPSIRYTGRLAGDALGQMTQGEGTLQAGSGSQTSIDRWGDYTSLNVDPADDCTFWYTNEYLTANGSFNWKTKIGSFRLSSCGGGTSTTNDFSISASPASLSLVTGGSASVSVSTTLASGSAEAVALSASGQPSGTTVSFNPASVTAGGSSTMTIAVGSTTPAGSYTVAVTGTSPSSTHTVGVALTVTPPSTVAPVVANGDFESGSLASWATAGVYPPRVVSGGHGGAYAAQLGSASPVKGNSTLTQKVTIPSGAPQLTFWYLPRCQDKLSNDQIVMKVRSTGGSTLATPLKVCSNTGTWTQVSFSLKSWAGKTVVLWFNVHDDGRAATPTYALLDDVAIG